MPTGGNGARRVKRKPAVLILAALGAIAATATEPDIAFPRGRIFPESITVTRGGFLFVSGTDDGAVWRARIGDTMAAEWLPPAASGMAALLGVYADERAGLLWACGRPRRGDDDAARDRSSALFAFDLATAKPRGRWQMPEGARAVCNDIAVGPDGSTYVAETAGGSILRLEGRTAALTRWFTDPLIAGADGIAFGTDGALYVSTLTTGRVFRLTIGGDGRPGALVPLQLSRSLDRPDGMRAVGRNRFLIGEQGPQGGIIEATLRGDRLFLRRLPGSRAGTTSAVAYKGRAFAVVSKSRFRAPEMAAQDPGPFSIYAVPLRP